jgi:hypothetical protein
MYVSLIDIYLLIISRGLFLMSDQVLIIPMMPIKKDLGIASRSVCGLNLVNAIKSENAE